MNGLPVGVYSIQGFAVRQPGTDVDTMLDGLDTTASVSANSVAAATVAYAPRPGSGMLWITTVSPPTITTPDFGVRGYSDTLLTAPATPPTSTVTPTPSASVAPEPGAERWFPVCTGQSLFRFTWETLGELANHSRLWIAVRRRGRIWSVTTHLWW